LKEIIYVNLDAIKDYDAPEIVTFLETYKTQECEKKISSELTEELRENGVTSLPLECSDMKKCTKTHSKNELRRNPFKEDGSLLYHPLPCRSVNLNVEKISDPNIQIG
jgi:hypothetical protein